MPDYPESILRAVAEVRLRQYENEFDASHLSWQDFASDAREILDALAPVAEYGILYSGGGHLTMNGSPEVEAIYPLADRIRTGGHVYRRRIVTVEDWEEITEPPSGEQP